MRHLFEILWWVSTSKPIWLFSSLALFSETDAPHPHSQSAHLVITPSPMILTQIQTTALNINKAAWYLPKGYADCSKQGANITLSVVQNELLWLCIKERIMHSE